MTKEEQLFLKHISDLANAAYQKVFPTSTDFLSLYEQDLFLSHREDVPPIDYKLNGGTPFSERKILCFLPDKELYADYLPISVLEIVPIQIKFSEELSHRDYLGALMNLGIERSMLGDILISEKKQAYLFCKQHMSDYIIEHLSFVKHTNMICRYFDGSVEEMQPHFEEQRGSVASPRLDSVLAVVFSGSRSKLSGLIEGKKVFVNSRLEESAAYQLKPNDIVSVRGYGKFIFEDMVGTTKKGRVMILVKRFVS